MNRRSFLLATAAPVAMNAAPRASTRIERVLVTTIDGRFHKFVAMNSNDVAPKGHTYNNSLVRVLTSDGIEGLGVMAGSPDAEFLRSLKQLIGADPMQLYRMEGGRISGRDPRFEALLARYMHLDGPLFDLVGKLTGKPCWKLIGEAARDKVEVYDGTLYFSDIWFKDRGVRAVVEEAEEAVRSGYLGLKFKIGRGSKWMETEAGLLRDVEVLKAVRKAVGPKVKILADANNGYRNDFDRAWRLMLETRDVNLYWMEEIFRENVEDYSRLRELMRKAGMKTLIADGEGVGEVSAFAPYVQPGKRLIDVLQRDIRRGGFLENLKMARMGDAAGAISVPHNWASQVGLFMGLHLAKAVKSVPAAEDDRSTCDALITEGYVFRSGFYTVPDSPGLGIRLNQEVYEKKYRAKEVAVS